MTITVVTPEHGKFAFPEANDWEIGQDEGDLGNLQVGSGLTNHGEFAKGSWVLVYETKEPEPVDLDEPLGEVEYPKVPGILSEEHRDRQWIDGQGWTFFHIDEGRWVATKVGHSSAFEYREPFGGSWSPLTEVVE